MNFTIYINWISRLTVWRSHRVSTTLSSGGHERLRGKDFEVFRMKAQDLTPLWWNFYHLVLEIAVKNFHLQRLQFNKPFPLFKSENIEAKLVII